jgi:hypothetical protein
MSSREIEESIDEIRGHIVDLLDTLDDRMAEPRLDEIIENGGTLRSSNLGQRPERCVEDALIWPTLESLGFEYTPRPYYPVGDDDERPDFSIDNLSETVIGENKSVNRFATARDDIESYLDTRRYEYGIATDGLRWGMYAIETDDNGRAELVGIIEEQDLTPAVQRIARDRGLVSYTKELQSEKTVDAALGSFYQMFNHYGVRRAIGGLTEFYDLYLEVISGDGEYQTLESNLHDSLDAPPGTSEEDQLAFAALLVDRLAFLKLLIDRGVLDDVALHDQWSEHNKGLNRFRGSFYSQYLQPLFYDSLATPPQRRDDDLPSSFGDVPFLAGGLFDRILSDERDYDVPDTVMKPVLSRFVEGEERTLVNEAAGGSLLQTYTEDFESRELAGQIAQAQHYSVLVDAYESEIEYVESEIERTLRSFTNPETN